MKSIFRVADDGLSRQRWDFSLGINGDSLQCRLTNYSIERRAFARGRFAKAGPVDRWECHDQRAYNSRLKTPTGVPDDVVLEAARFLTADIYIGFLDPESFLRSVKL